MESDTIYVLAALRGWHAGELFGFRAAFILIYSVAGLAQMAQVATGNAYVVPAGAFVGGLALAGNFVIGMLFMATNSSAADRAHVFSINSLLFSVTLAAGSLLGGYLPNLLARFTADLTLQHRYTLFVAGIFTMASIVPVCFLAPQVRRHERKISLKPYLWGIDSLSVKSAGIELFIGLTLGLIVLFMNLYLIFHLNTSREFFSTVEALGTSAEVGSGGYWGYRALFTMSQWLWLAVAMGTASAKARVAMSAWLEITFWLGQALAAIITGSLLAKSNYVLPFLLSTAAEAGEAA